MAALRAATEEEVTEAVPEEEERLQGVWEELYREVQVRHRAYDGAMREAYLRRPDLARFDVRFIFSPGDRVLLRQREKGKMKVRSTGPHIFLRYTGELGTTALLSVGGGRTLPVSATNLLPVDSWMARQRHIDRVLPEPAPEV